MITAGTSVTVTARVVNEVLSAAATTTEVVQDPSLWQLVVSFLSNLF